MSNERGGSQRKQHGDGRMARGLLSSPLLDNIQCNPRGTAAVRRKISL